MLRQYRSFFEKVFIALLYMRFRRGTSPREAFQYAVDEWHPGRPSIGRFEHADKLIHCARGIVENGGQQFTDDSWDGMLVEMADQLLVEEVKGPKDGTLIDRMVRVIGLPYARNALGARVLRDLRTALLLPDEMAQLGERLEAREMSCHMCRHIFQNNEMVTLLKDGHDVLMYCTRCHKPGIVSCTLCEEMSVGIDKKLHKLLEQVYDCGNHVEGADKPKQIQPAAPEGIRFTPGTLRPPDARQYITGGRLVTSGAAFAAGRPMFVREDSPFTTTVTLTNTPPTAGGDWGGRLIMDNPAVGRIEGIATAPVDIPHRWAFDDNDDPVLEPEDNDDGGINEPAPEPVRAERAADEEMITWARGINPLEPTIGPLLTRAQEREAANMGMTRETYIRWATLQEQERRRGR